MKQHSSKIRRPRSLRQEQGMTAPAVVKSGLALGLSTAMLVPLGAMAQQAAEPEATQNAELPAIKVQATKIDPNPNAEVGVPYKARTSGDARHTRPLAETPQTISVLTRTAIEESGRTDLKDILAAQPGITLGTGETGNAFGDRYIIRGQEARSDVFVDGLRDPGMTTRESFAIEQLEISKGPNSSFAGRGTAGGAINAITKQATLDYDFTRLSAGVGTDKYVRLTADTNKSFTDQFALRANVLWSGEDKPGYSPANRQRSGLALSGLFEVNKDLRIVVDYYGLRAKDKPDLGGYLLPAVGTAYRQPAKNVPSYVQDQDFLNSDVDTLTARVNYTIQPNLKLTNLTRYGQSDNRYFVSGATAQTAYANGATYSTGAITQSKDGWQDVTYFANQTNLRWDTPLFGKKNEFIFSLELTDHHVLNGRYGVSNTGAFNCRVGTTPGANNNFCITGPDGAPVAGVNSMMQRRIVKGAWDIDWHMKSVGLSVMDTVDLTDRWTAFAGLRADHYDLKFRNVGTNPATDSGSSDLIYSGHLGASYKITPQGMVYMSYATSSDVNGGESDVAVSSYGGPIVSNGSIAGAAPEISQNFEIGTKWNVLDNQLLLTAAIFQTDKSGVMEGTAGYSSTGTYNSGGNRVKGVEFEVSGNLTEKMSGQVGFAMMESEVTKSYVAGNVGKRLSNFANNSAAAQLKYQFTNAFALGGAYKYESERFGGQPDTAAGYNNCSGHYCVRLPSFSTVDLFATYRFTKRLDARLNVTNVADKTYYTAGYQSGAFLYRGDGRATRVTVNYEF